MMRPAPVVRMRGVLSTNGALITLALGEGAQGRQAHRDLLRVVLVPGQALVAARRATARTRAWPAFERNLRSGTQLTITLTRAGYVGKRTVFKIRRGKAPLRSDPCLSPATGKVQKCPAG